MRAIQIRLDEQLLASVDEAVKKLNTTRSGFARKALREAVNRTRIGELEKKHRLGYGRQPVRKGEFDVWEDEPPARATQ